MTSLSALGTKNGIIPGSSFTTICSIRIECSDDSHVKPWSLPSRPTLQKVGGGIIMLDTAWFTLHNNTNRPPKQRHIFLQLSKSAVNASSRRDDIVAAFRAGKRMDCKFKINAATPPCNVGFSTNVGSCPAGVPVAFMLLTPMPGLPDLFAHPAETIQLFELQLPELEVEVTVNEAGSFELPHDVSLPDDLPQHVFELRATRIADGETLTLTVMIALATGIELLVDRSWSMSQRVTRAERVKLDVARGAAHLVGSLYSDAARVVPATPTTSESRLAIGEFFSTDTDDKIELSALRPVSLSIEAAPQAIPTGHAPIGSALLLAQRALAEVAAARRETVVWTDSYDDGQAPRLEALESKVLEYQDDRNARNFVRALSYGAIAQSQSVDLHALSIAYGGRYQDSAADENPLDPNVLTAMSLATLGDMSSLEFVELEDDELVIEPAAQRVILVAYGEGELVAELNGTRSPEPVREFGYTRTVLTNPAPGSWKIVSRPAGAMVFALFESHIRTRAGIEAGEINEPITLWAEFTEGTKPIFDADVRVVVSSPAEALGELLTEFVHANEQELIENPIGPDRERLSVQRQLLTLLERKRRLPFQFRRQSLRLATSTRSPGRFEARIGTDFTRFEGTYTFKLHIEGALADGSRFVRDQRWSTVLAPVPNARYTRAWRSTQVVSTESETVVLVEPRTAVDKPLGPGCLRNLEIRYARQDDANNLPALTTNDEGDGTYSAVVTLLEGRVPRLVLDYRVAGAITPVASIVLTPRARASSGTPITQPPPRGELVDAE